MKFIIRLASLLCVGTLTASAFATSTVVNSAPSLGTTSQQVGCVNIDETAQPSSALAQGVDLDWVIKTGVQYFAPGIDLDMLINVGRGISLWNLWYCEYRDGTLVYNEFRFYRSTADVYMYFTGRPGSHDCDAWSEYGRFCTRDALQFSRQHGGIVGVGHATRG